MPGSGAPAPARKPPLPASGEGGGGGWDDWDDGVRPDMRRNQSTGSFAVSCTTSYQTFCSRFGNKLAETYFSSLPDSVVHDELVPIQSLIARVVISGDAVPTDVVAKQWLSAKVPHKFELHKLWLHVEGVPHSVRHFLGLWAVGSLVDRKVAMVDSKVLEKLADDSNIFVKSDVLVKRMIAKKGNVNGDDAADDDDPMDTSDTRTGPSEAITTHVQLGGSAAEGADGGVASALGPVSGVASQRVAVSPGPVADATVQQAARGGCTALSLSPGAIPSSSPAPAVEAGGVAMPPTRGGGPSLTTPPHTTVEVAAPTGPTRPGGVAEELPTASSAGSATADAYASLMSYGCRGGSSPTPSSPKADDALAGSQRCPVAPPSVAASMPSRRSTRHRVGPDGSATSGEDSLAKAMSRKAEENLDYAVSANALRRMEFDRIKLTPTILSKFDTSFSDEDDEEVYAISDRQLLSHLVGEVSEVSHGATVLMVALAYISVSRYVKEATSVAVSSNMYAPLDHVAAGMQAILTANHSAFVVAESVQIYCTPNYSCIFRYVLTCQVEQNLFMAFAMQPHVAEMSYAGLDGAAFTYYRGKDGRPRKMFGLRLVWQKEAMLHEIGVAVVSVVCLLAAMTTVACFFMARALWRAGSQEAALQGDLMRQKEALQQAERKSMNKSNAFTSASHDIRSSLSVIAGLINVSRTEARANPNLTYYLDQMEIGTKKLFDILNTILDMSKVESGKMQLEEVQFSMADVLEESMDMANVVGMSRGVEVVWDPCDFSVLRCDAVIGDCKRFKQILDNLLGNAIKFTQDGHVVLRAWANRPIAKTSMISTPSRFAPRWRASVFYRWLLGMREDGAEQNAHRSVQNYPNYLEFYFEVVDTGIGIAKEKRQSVFENYVQVKEGHGGTGLGLGIVQSLVRLMGGEISIKDKEAGEAGTCFGFNVFLKISDAEEDIEHGRAMPSFREPDCFKGGQCILLVHGDETRRILQTWMENVGMKVWPVLRAELLAPTMERARAAVGASPSRPASISLSQGDGDDLDGVADRCFSSKEMVTQVLRNSSGNHAGHLHPFGLLVVVDVSGGRLNEVLHEAPNLARIKHQVPCRVACISDLMSSSEDLRRLKEAASYDMDLRKPIHGSRLRKLLQVMRELQASPFPQQHSHQAGITINELPAADQATAVSSEITSAGEVPQEPPRLGDDKPLEAIAVSSETTAAAAVPQEPPKLEDDKPLEGKRVLLVEDTRVLQFIQKKMLSTLGATVVVAADGSEAVAMFINALEIAIDGSGSEERVASPYDLIFMDCQMPVMDGYEATKRIREEESCYGIHTPIIALTAHSEEEDLQKTIQAGMDLYLTKPIERKTVVESVHQVWKEDNN
ncbi:probable histidine kinase 2 [Lolium perenne]|uniref:probable histidine kinase 2 n=1 Tax=Lolium perenne TaxID=4522 RepID=UPI003A990BE9